MALSGGGPMSAISAKAAGLDDDFDVTRQKLEAGGLTQLGCGACGPESIRWNRRACAILGCRQTPESARCRVQVRYVYQVLREFPKEQVFAQVLGRIRPGRRRSPRGRRQFRPAGRRRHIHARLPSADAHGRLREEHLSQRPHHPARRRTGARSGAAGRPAVSHPRSRRTRPCRTHRPRRRHHAGARCRRAC